MPQPDRETCDVCGRLLITLNELERVECSRCQRDEAMADDDDRRYKREQERDDFDGIGTQSNTNA